MLSRVKEKKRSEETSRRLHSARGGRRGRRADLSNAREARDTNLRALARLQRHRSAPATPLTTSVAASLPDTLSRPLQQSRLQSAPTASLMPNMGVAAAILACLVTTCLMGGAHAAYSCSTKSDCAYKGCADVPCTSSSSYCKPPLNGVWDHGCVSALEYFFYCLHAQLARMITCSCCSMACRSPHRAQMSACAQFSCSYNSIDAQQLHAQRRQRHCVG